MQNILLPLFILASVSAWVTFVCARARMCGWFSKFLAIYFSAVFFFFLVRGRFACQAHRLVYFFVCSFFLPPFPFRFVLLIASMWMVRSNSGRPTHSKHLCNIVQNSFMSGSIYGEEKTKSGAREWTTIILTLVIISPLEKKRKEERWKKREKLLSFLDVVCSVISIYS